MKRRKVKPTISHDFALLAGSVLLMIVLLSCLVAYLSYQRHSERVLTELQIQGQRVDHALSGEIETANYILSAVGRQITYFPQDDLQPIAQLLKAFEARTQVFSMFSWVNAEQQVAASSNQGVLEKPVDVSDRDYVKKSLAEPWKMQIGRPIEGRVSGRWVVPVSMGLTDNTGKYLGTLAISIDIHELTQKISGVVHKDGINFAIISRTLITLTEVSDEDNFLPHHFPLDKLKMIDFNEQPQAIISKESFLGLSGNYAYYMSSSQFPYIILLALDPSQNADAISTILWPRIFQIIVLMGFLMAFLWMIRTRIIRPVMDMTDAAAALARGESEPKLPQRGPQEIALLAQQIRKVGDYIAERRRIEDEMRNKMGMLRKAKEKAELSNRSKSQFLAFMCNELRTPLTAIVGYAQVMKDQLYGPIENRKYRQYAQDIFSSGNSLITHTQDILLFVKAETESLPLHEAPQDVNAMIQKAVRYLADRMQAEKITIRLKIAEPLPRLMGDDFRLQQMLVNMLLYSANDAQSGDYLTVDARHINLEKSERCLLITIAHGEPEVPAGASLRELIERTVPMGSTLPLDDEMEFESYSNDIAELSLALGKMLLRLHGASFRLDKRGDGRQQVILCFPGDRLKPSSAGE